MVPSYEGPIKKWVLRRRADNMVVADRVIDRNEAQYQMIGVLPQPMTAYVKLTEVPAVEGETLTAKTPGRPTRVAGRQPHFSDNPARLIDAAPAT